MKAQFIDTAIHQHKFFYINKVDTPYLNKPLHFHSNCELVMIEEGYGKRIVGDSVSNFLEGDLVMIGPSLPHIWLNDMAFYSGNKKLRSRAIVVYFIPEVLESIVDEGNLVYVKKLISKSKRGLRITGKTREDVIKRLKILPKLKGLKQVIEFLSIIDIISQSRNLKYLSVPQYTNLYNEKDTDRINLIYYFLIHNFHRQITLKETASLANMAPTAFSRYFRQRTQKSLFRLINELRIRHACKLLADKEKTIGEICYECGYQNQTNFNKFFKKITLTTPSIYRKGLTQLNDSGS
jgi:AraC-like DNA-binding protein